MATSDALNRLGTARKARSVGIAQATVGKFRQDRSPYLAAIVAFWGFFSIFPLLLLFVSLLGYFLPASDKSSVLHHVSSMFPMLDPTTVGHLSGNAWSVLVGAVSALWGGTAVMRAAQYALNSAWGLPNSERPKLVAQLKRSVIALGTIGTGLVVSVVVSDFVTGSSNGVNLGTAGRVGGYVLAAALDVGLFLAAFKILTNEPVRLPEVLPGALLAGVAFWILEQLSSFIISRHLQQAQSTYGHFATVITILWWFYVQGLVTMLGAELNAVLRAHRRSGIQVPRDGADSH